MLCVERRTAPSLGIVLSVAIGGGGSSGGGDIVVNVGVGVAGGVVVVIVIAVASAVDRMVIGSSHARGGLGRHEVVPTWLGEQVFLMLMGKSRRVCRLRQDGGREGGGWLSFSCVTLNVPMYEQQRRQDRSVGNARRLDFSVQGKHRQVSSRRRRLDLAQSRLARSDGRAVGLGLGLCSEKRSRGALVLPLNEPFVSGSDD